MTSIHEHWFCARCVNTKKRDGEGVIVMHIGAYLLVLVYVHAYSIFIYENNHHVLIMNWFQNGWLTYTVY